MQNGQGIELLDVHNLNPKLLKAEYAVRGAIAVKSQDYQQQLKDGKLLPFNKVLQCNIGELGDPRAQGSPALAAPR
jgi:alanine transaminase